MEKWVEIRKSGDFGKIASDFNVSPITARILRNRDLVAPSDIERFLYPGDAMLNDPMMLNGMDRVIFVLKEKIDQKKKLHIIGDYDVDGICATYILYKGLSFFGADATYSIPHRIEDGYGINDKLIKDAYDNGADTIITCDNGIAASAQTDYAHSLSMTMIITDHHEVPFSETDGHREYNIPNADAIVDPKLPGCEYPFPGICGAYVAFQVILALSKEMERTEGFDVLKNELLEFASLATVCDVMELKDENRSLVYQGSRLMTNSSNLGLRTLIRVTGLEGKLINPYHMGFVIGPCLNASGRLDTSLRALDLFLEKDAALAEKKAEALKALNEERKEMTLFETAKAFEIVDKAGTSDKVLVIYLPDCHESLAGIIAGRVREKYVRPTFVITKTENGLKGSGRSIDAYDMFEGLTKVGHLLTKFGGHKLAAGISLNPENLDELRHKLNENCTLCDDEFYETVRIDMELPFEYATLSLARELTKLEPFGTGNEKPNFAIRNITVVSKFRIGKNKNIGKYKVKDANGRVYEMIYFGDADEFEKFLESTNDNADIVYQIDVNSYNGIDSVSIQMKTFR